MGTKMEEAIEMVQAKDTKERMAGVERLQQLLEHSTKALTAAEVSNLVDASLALSKDNNFRVSQGALQALASAAALSGEHLKLHFNALLPAIVERLGDGKQPVRDAARRLLLALMEVSSPTIIVERAGSYAWTHKSWRVREEFARTVANAISLFAATELPFQRVLLPSVLQLLDDSNSNAREAAILCFEEMYQHGGPQFREELQRHSLRPSQLKEINARLEKIEPKVRSFDALGGNVASSEIKSSASLPVMGNKRNSPKAKTAVREASLAGDNEVTEKPVDPVKVYSEKELLREIDKIIGMLAPEQDWLVRITAMQRIEGLVLEVSATDYACFPTLLKQLVGPLTVQLSDRRSSIVKQACHLLSLLSKELLGDFEACAELFIPALFKLVVITVLVIAESADNCIKTMLRNCKVSRILPRIADTAKNDRNAVLRARCCEYALLVLEYWADAPEIQRAADLYEDLIKCCVGDAISEVRSTARMCYRMFTKTWPERSRRLFSSFDHTVQRLINEEEGGIHKRYASPSIRDRAAQPLRNPVQTNTNIQPLATSMVPGYGTSAIVAMDRSASLSSGSSLPIHGSLLVPQRKHSEQATERSLESVLQASKQQVSAIESMLRGLDSSDKGSGSTIARPAFKDPANEVGGSYRRIQTSGFPIRSGVDPPSSRDPPFPASASTMGQIANRTSTSASMYKSAARGNALIGDYLDVTPSQVPVSIDVGRTSYLSGVNNDTSSALTTSYTAKRVPLTYERLNQRSSFEENDIKAPRRVLRLEPQMEKLYLDTPYKDSSYKDSQYNSIPNFQRPLLRKYGTGRSSASNRLSIEDNQLPAGEMYNYMDGLTSLNDALTEGLSVSADWSARVAAFNYIKKLLQQGPKGVQDVIQNFEKIMKLFFQHLDDPHHKVAQAALSTLTELVPSCRKPFDSYLERILPHVFSRLVDPKELIRQLCSSLLEIVGNTYSIDLILPALLRSLDEQRSPKAKVAVIEFAISSFTKLGMNGETSSGSGLLKLWLAKLAPLANDKNTKLKETAVTGIISVYTHFDSTAVLNFILGLSIEEQSTLRRALKQYTPRIEVDLMNFLQSKNQRARSKSLYDQSDIVGTSSEEGYSGTGTRKAQFYGRYSSGSVDSDGGRKWSSVQEPMQFSSNATRETMSEEQQKHVYQSYESSINLEEVHSYVKIKDSRNSIEAATEKLATWIDDTLPPNLDARLEYENSVGTPHRDPRGFTNIDTQQGVLDTKFSGEPHPEEELINETITHEPLQESGPSIPTLIHQMCNGNDEISVRKKREALQMLVEVSRTNDTSIWSKYFNQILTSVLEVLDDPDSAVRELALSVIVEMLNNQKDTLEDSVEILLEKLLHATKDPVAKVSSEADRCATTVLSQYDPYRCLTVVVPLLVSEDDKTLVTCIGCLTKLVGRLPSEELMAQLPSFLPALFDAFGNQSADVRKTVVFCLVDIYIVLGKAFLPYLGSLSSTQLRLVTIYANRISQARSGAAVDSNHA